MTEERKHAILFAATLLCARKLIETIESDKPNKAEEFFIKRAVKKAEATTQSCSASVACCVMQA